MFDKVNNENLSISKGGERVRPSKQFKAGS